MSNRITEAMRLLGKLVARFPKEAGVHPNSFAIPLMVSTSQSQAASGTVVFQGVPDKFYFLLFGAIRRVLQSQLNGPAELLVVRSISGAIGVGWIAAIKRWSVVAWLLSKPWERAYGDVMSGIAYRCVTWRHPLDDLRDWFKSKTLWQNLQNQDEAFNLEVDGIEVGDLIVDSYLRFRPSPRFDEKDPFVRRLVWQALRDVRQAQQYFRTAKPKLYLTSYSTYIEHGIAVRVALQHGVRVWSFGNLTRYGKRLSLQDAYHTPDCSHYRSIFEKLDRQEERLDEARAQLELRLAGGIDTATSYMRRSAYSASNALVPEGLNRAVVIFLHDFYDSPHVYPTLVFCDFWRWICFTIETLQRTGISFYLKPHPNQIALSDTALAELRKKYPNLNWLPSGVTNVQLANAGIICGITVYGTVAHELAYLGVPSIGCAQHPHHTFDFCRTARTKEEYQAFLESPTALPVEKSEMQRQALAFYYMHNLYGSAEERELCRAFVQFWRACNSGEMTAKSVLESFWCLVELPAFEAYAEQLLN